MAFTNDPEVTAYINKLKELTYVDKGVVKTGADNYKAIITYTESIISRRKKEKQLLLNNINTQLNKVQYYITKLEENLDTNNLYNNINIFQTNMSTLGDTSSKMVDISSKVLSVISIESTKLKQYKRTKKELVVKSIVLRNLLKFYEDSSAILNELNTVLS